MTRESQSTDLPTRTFGPMEDLIEEIARTEAVVERELDCEREKVRAADHALSMLRNAARVGTPKKVKDTLNTIRLLAPVEVLDAISAPMEHAQSFVFARTGNAVKITR